MAEVKVSPDGSTDTTGTWTPSGAATSHEAVDETIASADGGSTITTPAAENDAITFDLASPGLSDADTISQVDVHVHGRTSGSGADQFGVELLIGGVVQGVSQSTGDLTGSHATYGPLNDAAWNADWTAAQLNGMQVRVTANQTGMPATVGHELSTVEVTVTYTAASGGTGGAMVHHLRNLGAF